MTSGESPNLPAPVEPQETPREARRGEDARDFARLLVSDIRLYHEEQVIAGRRAGDVEARLAQPIAAARERFQRRFSRPADAEVFAHELRTILLGKEPTGHQ